MKRLNYLASTFGAAVFFAVAAGGAAASSVTPVEYPGTRNASCKTYDTTVGTLFEYKIEEESGNYSGIFVNPNVLDPPGSVTLNNYFGAADGKSGELVDWLNNLAASTQITSVFVKGGPTGNLYLYTNQTSDTGLHSPAANPTTWANISHISICYIVKVTEEDFQGCSHGYWKVPQHHDSWPAPYLPTTLLKSVFDVAANGANLPWPGHTLLQALNYKGASGAPGATLALKKLNGAKQILLMQAVGALLNAAYPDSIINYPWTKAQVIANVNAVLAANDIDDILDLASTLDAYAQLGCPLK